MQRSRRAAQASGADASSSGVGRSRRGQRTADPAAHGSSRARARCDRRYQAFAGNREYVSGARGRRPWLSAAHPVDQTFNVRLRSHYDAVNAAFAPAKYFGNTPEQAAMSLGTYAYGRIFHQPKVSHLGMDLLRAQILTEMLVRADQVRDAS